MLEQDFSNSPFSPRMLRASSARVEVEPSGSLSENTNDDCACYRVLNDAGDLQRSGIADHNGIDIVGLSRQWRAIRRLLGVARFSHVIDLGCGAGFQTHAIRQAFPDSRVHGIEISSDAIAYGRRCFTAVDFIHGVIDPDDKERCALHAWRSLAASGAEASLITACEFYPFTRTDAWDVQRTWLANLLIDSRATVVVKLSNRYRAGVDPTKLSNLDRLRNEFTVSIHRVCVPRLSRFVPSSLNILSAALCAVTPLHQVQARIDNILLIRHQGTGRI